MSVFFALIALLIVHFAYTATALFMGDVSQRKAQIIRTSSTALWITALPFACIMSFAFTLQECTVPAYGDVCPSTLSCHYYSLGGITCGYAVSDTASIG